MYITTINGHSLTRPSRQRIRRSDANRRPSKKKPFHWELMPRVTHWLDAKTHTRWQQNATPPTSHVARAYGLARATATHTRRSADGYCRQKCQKKVTTLSAPRNTTIADRVTSAQITLTSIKTHGQAAIGLDRLTRPRSLANPTHYTTARGPTAYGNRKLISYHVLPRYIVLVMFGHTMALLSFVPPRAAFLHKIKCSRTKAQASDLETNTPMRPIDPTKSHVHSRRRPLTTEWRQQQWQKKRAEEKRHDARHTQQRAPH